MFRDGIRSRSSAAPILITRDNFAEGISHRFVIPKFVTCPRKGTVTSSVA